MSMPVAPFASESERIYHSTPDVSPEREAAWRRWVDDYALGCSLSWLNDSEVTDEEALDAAEIVVSDLGRIDHWDWMPLGHALSYLAGTERSVGSNDPLQGDARLEYMSALRTARTSTASERTYAIAYQLGITVTQARKMVGNIESNATRESESPGRTALYRCFDKDDVLLYVGITKDPEARDEQHKQTSPWFPLQARRTVEWFDSRSEAAAAERWSIGAEEPLFNSTHSTAETKRRSVEYLIARVAAAEARAS